MRKFKAKFSCGLTIERESLKTLTHAWKITFLGKDGSTIQRTGFSVSETQAAINMHKECPRSRMISEEVVPVLDGTAEKQAAA